MKAVIFAGGVGTRLWPLSRKKSPKQFERIVGDKSTLELAVERLFPEFKPEDIFISTGEQYVDVALRQLPYLPKRNIIGEPVKKDVGPAVAFAMGYLAKKYKKNEPVVILWSDHLVREGKKFKQILQAASEIIQKDENKIIFIGQRPRFPSDNLGWIEFGSKIKKDNGVPFYRFGGFKYKPNKELAEKYFKDRRHCWNLGYFVSTPQFIFNTFKKLAPQIYKLTEEILQHTGSKNFSKIFRKYYDQMPIISFDNAILERLDKQNAYVAVEDIGWSDIGAWEALKEALEAKKSDNITSGKVLLQDSTDNLVYNSEDGKMIVGIDLNELLVVNTGDVLLVTKKSSVSKIKKLVEGLEGTEHERLT